MGVAYSRPCKYEKLLLQYCVNNHYSDISCMSMHSSRNKFLGNTNWTFPTVLVKDRLLEYMVQIWQQSHWQGFIGGGSRNWQHVTEGGWGSRLQAEVHWFFTKMEETNCFSVLYMHKIYI